MTDEVVYAEPDETILTVTERMTNSGVRHLPVVEHGTTVGVVSTRDVLPILVSYARSTTS